MSELESELSRLLRALDSEKESRGSSEKDLRSKIEDLNKEVGTKVGVYLQLSINATRLTYRLVSSR